MRRGRHGDPRWLRHGLIAGLALALAGSSCSDRDIGEQEPPPDIEGLCKAHCVRVMECRWRPDSGYTFSTEAECRHNCAADHLWNKCPQENEAMFACTTQYDCPEFSSVGTDYPDGACVAEVSALSTCPGRRS